jgi:hypothetical protein
LRARVKTIAIHCLVVKPIFFNLTILVCQANQAIEKQDIKIRMSGASLKTSSFMNLTTCDLAGSLGSLI